MKKLILLSLFFISVISYTQAKGIPIPVCFPCEEITVVEELPDEENLKPEQAGYYLDLGYIYEEYGIVFIPFWNIEGKYVLYNKNHSTYYEITAEELQELQEKYDLDLDDNPLGLWAKFGGKLILMGFIGLAIFGMLSKSDEEEEEQK
ncbi:hypothetical protein WAF17_08575 [Bernardetia sp. ABR2-2B]|uniref:hypothetical protein n=1 Tax=Bernardetia sp. ABR2-2B TaxID=3127472 RepID=UPI0030CEC679